MCVGLTTSLKKLQKRQCKLQMKVFKYWAISLQRPDNYYSRPMMLIHVNQTILIDMPWSGWASSAN